MESDLLAIAPNQTIFCQICEKEFNSSETKMYFAMPPFGIGALPRITCCAFCVQGVRWTTDDEEDDESEKKGEKKEEKKRGKRKSWQSRGNKKHSLIRIGV